MYTPPVTPPELGIPEGGGSQPATEAASEGRPSEGGEVVTRQVYRKVRLDHLLSKEISGRDRLLSVFQGPGRRELGE